MKVTTSSRAHHLPPSLTRTQIQYLKRSFDVLDQARNGYLSVEDCASLLRALSQTYVDTEILLQHYSHLIHNDIIDFYNFCKLVQELEMEAAEGVSYFIMDDDNTSTTSSSSSSRHQQHLAAVFNEFDRDSKGYVSLQDLKELVLQELNSEVVADEALNAMIQTFASSNREEEGRIDFETFCYIMR